MADENNFYDDDFYTDYDNEGGQDEGNQPTGEDNKQGNQDDPFKQVNEKLQQLEQQNQQLAQQNQSLSQWKQDMARFIAGDQGQQQGLTDEQIYSQLTREPSKFAETLISEAENRAYQKMQQEQAMQQQLNTVKNYVSTQYKDLVDSGWESALYAEANLAVQQAQMYGQQLNLQDAFEQSAQSLRQRLGNSVKQGRSDAVRRNSMNWGLQGSGNQSQSDNSEKLFGKTTQDMWNMDRSEWAKFRQNVMRRSYQ